jgi:hypothetical protein
LAKLLLKFMKKLKISCAKHVHVRGLHLPLGKDKLVIIPSLTNSTKLVHVAIN